MIGGDKTATLTKDDRFTVPLYTLGEAASYLRVPKSTLTTWADGYEHRRLERQGVRTVRGASSVTAVPSRSRGHARLPFIGIAEAYVLMPSDVPAFPCSASGRRWTG